MPDLPRLTPDPIPAIHPLSEYGVEGTRKALYDDTKRVMQVPWVGVVTMAFAHYEHFYTALCTGWTRWWRARPSSAPARR